MRNNFNKIIIKILFIITLLFLLFPFNNFTFPSIFKFDQNSYFKCSDINNKLSYIYKNENEFQILLKWKNDNKISQFLFNNNSYRICISLFFYKLADTFINLKSTGNKYQLFSKPPPFYIS